MGQNAPFPRFTLKLLKNFLKTTKDQIFGRDEELPREGKLVLTRKAFDKMVEWQLSEETLKLTYEVGEKTKKEKGVYQIVRAYKF